MNNDAVVPVRGRRNSREKPVKLGVGDYCQAKNKKGLWLRGRILGKRRLQGSTKGERVEQWEYFVHFDGKDWKFDEWVTADGLQPELPEVEGVGLNLELEGDGAAAGGQRRRSARLSTENEKGDEVKGHESIAELKHNVRYVETVKVGKYEIRTWYAAPFNHKQDVRYLYFCEFCLRFTSKLEAYKYHWHVCPCFGPPGKDIYRKDEVTIREVDGATSTHYCQCLCLLGKAFIHNKDLVFSVEGFMFYVLCEVDHKGEHLVGFFSKNKKVTDGSINLSCIMILPPYQGKGYGKLLIDLSYRMSRIMGQTGTPERPISDLGLLSYTSYWRWVLLSHFKDMCEQDVPIELWRVAKLTGVSEGDLVKTMTELGFVKGDETGAKKINIPKKLIQENIEKFNVKRPKSFIRTECLAWVPPPPPPPKPEEPKPKPL